MHTLKAFFILAVILCQAGCNSDRENAVRQRRTDLAELSLAYHAYQTKHGVAPSSAEQLSNHLLSSGPDDASENDRVVESLTDGEIVMVWNAVFGENADQSLLGYEARVPRSGGYIVTVSGKVQLVTAKQFGNMTVISTTSGG